MSMPLPRLPFSILDCYGRASTLWPNAYFDGGTGLGLWISAEIVECHYGRVWIRSSRKEGLSWPYSSRSRAFRLREATRTARLRTKLRVILPSRSSNVSVRQNHIDSYRLLAAHAVGVSSGSLWMDKLASPGRTAARYSRTGILSRRQVSTMERIAATRGPAFS